MKTCPNCSASFPHPENGCALAMLISVISDRGTKTDAEIDALMTDCDVSALWDDLGPIVDKLENGGYKT